MKYQKEKKSLESKNHCGKSVPRNSLLPQLQSPAVVSMAGDLHNKFVFLILIRNIKQAECVYQNMPKKNANDALRAALDMIF